MNTLSLAALAQIALSCPTYSPVPAESVLRRVAATAQVESGMTPTAMHDNTTQHSYAPDTDAEAIALAATLRAQGHSVDAGLMQINDANWARFGLTAETVFDPRRNVCAGIMILAEAYAIERRVSCRYNTGRPDCTNGYPERIERALRRVSAEAVTADTPSTSAKNEVSSAPTPIEPFVRHGPVREIMFVPSFHPAAPLQLGARSAVPAAPNHLPAATDRIRGELVTMRSVSR